LLSRARNTRKGGSALKVADGNRGKRRIDPDLNAHGKPECPDYFSADQRLRWQRLMAVLPNKLLAAADTAIVERFIVAWQRFRDCEIMIAKSGMLIQTPTGPKRNPLLGIQLHCDRVMAGAGIELGLSPVARARLARPEHETDQDDAFKAYIFGDTIN
jgi:P27 family predicted phage terminase small subunit